MSEHLPDTATEAAGAAAGRAEDGDGASPRPGPDQATRDQPFGRPGVPLNRHSPFYIGFVGATGVLIAYGLLQTVARLSQVITLLVVSLFLALGLAPVVDWLQEHGARRRFAVATVFAGVILAFIAFIALVVPPLATQSGQLVQQAPDYVSNLLDNPTVQRLDDQYGVVSNLEAQLQRRAQDGATWTTLFGGVLGAGKAVVSGFVSAFTVLILTLYFLASLPSVKRSAYLMVPVSRRQRVTFLGEEISKRVGGYVMGQVAVATINAVLSYVVMKVLGIPFAAVLAVTVGVLGLIPMIGATLGALIVLIVALFDSWQVAVAVAVYYLVYQQVENYVIVPRIMSRTVAVPGAVTVIAALAGATLLGVLGALIAIPAAAGLLLLYQEVLLPRQQQH